jgi:hypothetical protein
MLVNTKKTRYIACFLFIFAISLLGLNFIVFFRSPATPPNPKEHQMTREEFEKLYVTSDDLIPSDGGWTKLSKDTYSTTYMTIHEIKENTGVVYISLLTDFNKPQYGNYELGLAANTTIFNYPYNSKSYLKVVRCKERTIQVLQDAYFSQNMGRNRIETDPNMNYRPVPLSEKMYLALCNN